MATSFGEVMIRYGADVSNFSLGTAAVIAGLVAVGAAVVESVKKAGDYEASITRLSTSAGEFAKNLPMVSAGILKMSIDTATSTQQLAAGMYFVESAGHHGADALAVLGVAARGARAENADLDVVAKALTTTMTDYHMPVSQAAAAMNGLIQTVKNGKTNLQDLSSSMGAVLPIASALHISFPQVAGAMDTMTNAGMTSRQAAMNLAHVLLALQAPSGIAVSAMQTVGLSAQQVKDALVNKGLPQALQLIEDHVGQKFPKSSVEYQTALKDILGGIVGFKLAAQLTGDSLKQTELNIAAVAKAMANGKAGVMGWTEVQATFNFKLDQAKMAVDALMISVGTLLLPVLGRILGVITPIIASFASWVASGHALNDVLAFFHANTAVLIPVLAGIGAIIASVLVPAVWSLAAGVIAATWPFVAIGLAVAGLTAIFLHFYTTNAPFRSFIDGIGQALQRLWQGAQSLLPIWNQVVAAFNAVFNPVQKAAAALKPLTDNFDRCTQLLRPLTAAVKPLTDAVDRGSVYFDKFSNAGKRVTDTLNPFIPVFKAVASALSGFGNFLSTVVWPILQRVGAYLVTTFQPVWDQLVHTINVELKPAWDSLVKAIQPVLPQLQQFGQFLLGAVAFALTIVISLIGGLIHGLASALSGIISIIGGVVSVLTGAIKIITGIVSLVVDLVTFKFDKLGSDLGLIMDGIGTMFHGVWEIIKGIFQTVIGFIIGFCAGFVQTLVGIFQALSDTLVGHSIIPDMMAAILGYFTNLVTTGENLFRSLAGTLTSVWENIKAGASAAWNWVVSTVTGLITQLWTSVTSRAAQMRDSFLSAFSSIRDGIGGIVRAMANNAIGQLNGMLNSLRSFLQFFASAINGVAQAVGAGSPVHVPPIGNIAYLAQGTDNFAGGPAIVGERGRELVMLPRGASVLPNEETEQLLRSGVLGPLIPGFAGGTGNAIADLVSWFTGGGAGNVLSHVFSASLHFSGAMEGVASALMGMVKNWGLDKIGAMLGKYMADLAAKAAAAAASGLAGFAGGPVSGNLAGWITAAMGLTGVPSSWLSALETIAMYESGGNPRAINLTDSNAAAGHPSQGLFQTIPSTFSAYALGGHTDMVNPIDNAAAAIRYIQSRYGSVFNVPGIVSLARGGGYVGYGNGGIINEQILGIGASGQHYRFGENGPERVTPLGSEQPVTVNLNVDGRTLAQAMGPFLSNELRINLGVRR